ncbi:spermidine synthase [Cellulomonas marina]|uniref:Spermidine synthase n=1 Tax=Cellulomonas marina TaxID=988821 RepID=A0A1I0VL00_9CELL|nr:fused MFS/spermidine synthase [Cellulomonas marina]GIG27917.1 hypothetical protein Cma02nite_05170 [Cellulomonas marina]SFA76703.1 Spermidine synthase [Cellulomonas marina]
MTVPTGTVRVVSDPDRPRLVTLLVNEVPSSALDLDDPAWLDFEYMQQMALVVDAAAPGGTSVDVVHLGAGGCALARALDARHPGSRQLAVELDTALPDLARAWFGLPRAPRLRIRAGDARAVLAALPTASADVVVRDVFAGATTPPHVRTHGFTAEAVRVLRPGGVYLANAADRPPLAAARSEAATLRRLFAHVAVVAEPGLLRGRGYGNVVLVGTDRDGLLDDPVLARAVRSLPAPARLLVGPDLDAFVGTAPPLVDAAAPPDVDAAAPLDDDGPQP